MTEMTEFQRRIQGFFPEIVMAFNEPMGKHTSFKIGGPAEVMAFPKNSEQLAKLLKTSQLLDCKIAILGAGTNILAPDDGVSGLVICLKDSLEGMEQIGDNTIRVAAGVSMARAANFAASKNLSGMEFAHGIPGTVGGGVYMNAGAYGGEICQVCTRVGVMDMAGNEKVYFGEEMEFSYRHSRLEREKGIVLWAEFSLTSKPQEEIRSTMQDLMNRRRASQPLEKPSAGSAFKRPQGAYAAALIEEAGLKGYRMGNAAVSDKHAGFVVNLGGATANEVKALLKEVQKQVYEKSGFQLEPEVRIW